MRTRAFCLALASVSIPPAQALCPGGAPPTQVEFIGMPAPDYQGHAYIMANFQHPGDEDLKSYKGADRAEVQARINAEWGDRKQAAIGYIGTDEAALPAWQ